MKNAPGTTGYEKVVEAFTEASLKLDFSEIHKEFFELLPPLPARVLDAGSGVGQNAAVFSRRGYEVVAVEPLPEFLEVARSTFPDLNIKWVHDSLPLLDKLKNDDETFDFGLMDGVWHHLNQQERRECIKRFSELLNPGGICAISLRNGPGRSRDAYFSY